MEETRTQQVYSVQRLHRTMFDRNYELFKCGILRKSNQSREEREEELEECLLGSL